MATEGPRQIANQLNEEPEGVLRSFTQPMMTPSTFIVGKGGQYVVVLGHEHALAVRQAGWTKEDVREFLAEHSRVSPDELVERRHPHRDRGPARHDAGRRRQAPVGRRADDIVLVTAGGPGAGWSACCPPGRR